MCVYQLGALDEAYIQLTIHFRLWFVSATTDDVRDHIYIAAYIVFLGADVIKTR